MSFVRLLFNAFNGKLLLYQSQASSHSIAAKKQNREKNAEQECRKRKQERKAGLPILPCRTSCKHSPGVNLSEKVVELRRLRTHKTQRRSFNKAQRNDYLNKFRRPKYRVVESTLSSWSAVRLVIPK